MRRLCAVLAACLLLTGCWDKVELENRGFIVSMGIDKDNGQFSLSMTMPDAAAIAGKDDGGERRLLLHGQGESLPAAIRDADSGIGKSLFFGQTKLAVFGAECLADADMLSQAADALDRGSEWSRKLLILAADESVSAADVLNADSPGEPLVGTFVSNFYKTNESPVVKTDLERLTHALNTSGVAVLPRAAVEDKKIVLSGAAVLKDGALAGWLAAEEVRGLFWLHGEGENALVTAMYENVPAPFHVAQCTRSLAFAEDNEGLVCTLRLRVAGSVESLMLAPDMLTDGGVMAELSLLYADEIAAEAARMFDILRDEFAADALDLQEELYKREPDLYRRFADDWASAYAGMRLETDVVVKLLR